MLLQEVRPLDDSTEAAHTAVVVSELSDAMRGILEVGARTRSPSPTGHDRPAYGRGLRNDMLVLGRPTRQSLAVRGCAVCWHTPGACG